MAPILLLFGQDPSVVRLATLYLHALAWGILPNFILLVFLDFMMGLGHTRIIMIYSIISVMMIIFFSFSFIFGKFGMPALGIAGAGWGVAVSNWIGAFILAIYVLTHKNYRRYISHIFNLSKPSYLWELIQVGVPMGFMFCVEVSFFFVLVLLMGSLSSQWLAANQVVFQYMGTLTAVVFSIAQATTVRMGHLLGAKEISSAENANYAGILIAASFMGIIAIFYWLFPSVLISIDFDIHNPNNFEIINDIKKLFAICAIFQILEAIRLSLFGALRSLKDTNFTLLTSIISFWCIALPVGYFLAKNMQLSGPGLWWGMVMGAFCGVLLLIFRFQLKIRPYYKST
jgi:MATE family multidrug resistance protein